MKASRLRVARRGVPGSSRVGLAQVTPIATAYAPPVRVAFTCTPLAGHVLPMLPLARALADSGHEVIFVTGGDVRSLLADAGFDLVPAGPPFDALVVDALSRYPDTPLATPEDQQRFGFGRLFSELRVESMHAEARRVVEHLSPDVVVHEVADFVGPLVAAERGLPAVAVGIGLLPGDDLLSAAGAGVATAWRSCGLEPPPDGGLRRSLYLNQLPRSIQRDSVAALPAVADLRPITHGAGESLPPDLDHLGADRPLVYVTFGTVFGDAAVVNGVIAGLAYLDVDALVTVGGAIDPVQFDAPDQVMVRSFVPQGAVLGRCRAVLTHGGVGSVLGPLSAGLPLLVAPLGADQAENADALVGRGAAHRLDPVDLQRPELVAEAIDRVLEADDLRVAAREVSGEIAAMPAPSDVVGLIEAHLSQT